MYVCMLCLMKFIRDFPMKDGSVVQIKTTLAQMRRVGELKYNFGFRIYLMSIRKNIP